MNKEIYKKALDKGIFNTVEKISKVMSLYKPENDMAVPLGISNFDNAIDRGVREGELIVISGQTGSGKTTFSQNLAVNISDIDVPSLWFSYEMNPYYLGNNFKKIIKEASLNDLLVYSPIELQERNLKFMEEKIKEGTDKQAIKVVFIDHLHYLIDLKSSTNSSLMIGGIVRELKQMAIRNNVTIFLIAHTKKIGLDERISLSSIRDSSLISQEADYVFLVERKRNSKKLEEEQGTEWSNKTRIHIAKNRRTGKMFYLDFRFKDGKFIETDKQHYETHKFRSN